jgi:integrase
MPRANQGPRLKRNERGIYEIHWTDNGRSRRSSTRTGDPQSAQRILGTFLLLGERDQRAAQEGVVLVMDVLGDEDIPGEDYWHKHVVPNVVDKDSVRYAYAKLKPHFGHLPVADITPADVDAYVEARRTGKLGRPSVNHTISRELSVLNAAINHAVKKTKRVRKVDQPFIELPGTSEPRDRWLTFDEADRLLAAALNGTPDDKPLPRVYRFVALALNTAARRGAILELRRSQVDMKAGIIYLNPPGRKQTKKRRAKVPISDALRPIVERIMREIPDRPDAHLLDHGGSIRTAFESAVSRAKLGSDVTPHVLRHTKATWAALAGMSMFDIAGVLGDSVATVTKTYAHHHPDYLRDVVNVGRKVR